MMNTNFSVLLSVYHKENPVYLNQAMESIWDSQILKPTEIILVEDGELTPELYTVIQKWQISLSSVFRVIKLPVNIGLAMALNEGLKQCNFDFVARMDTDDISLPIRFKKQIEFLNINPTIDVVGTFISEIDEYDVTVKSIIELPLSHDELRFFFKKRNPLIHPTTMFRKTYFEKAGNYSNELILAEDYHLWYKGFLNGCIFANIPIIGLKFRRSNKFYKRRGSMKKIVNLLIFRLTKCNRNLKFGITSDLYAITYFFIQLSPMVIRKIAYKLLR